MKIRRAPHARHDNVDFKLIMTRTTEIKPLSIVVGDKWITAKMRCFDNKTEGEKWYAWQTALRIVQSIVLHVNKI